MAPSPTLPQNREGRLGNADSENMSISENTFRTCRNPSPPLGGFRGLVVRHLKYNYLKIC